MSAGMSENEISQPEPAIRLQNVIKRFDGRTVLDGVTLDILPGETLVVMGGSGCGKSTLLRMTIGSFAPDEGTIHVLGHQIVGMEEEELNEVRKKFGILFQSGALFNSMTLRQNVALPLEEHTSLDPATIDIMVKIKLELVGLREHAEKYPSQISGGMKKRAGLARALALDPQILFYDEPSAGLDPVTSAEIDTLMMNLSGRLGVTSVVVTHEMDSAFRIADRMVMLDKGRVLRVGPRSDFEALRDAKGQLNDTDALIRQFLRGDAEGPITQRKQGSAYADDLLGGGPDVTEMRPSIAASRFVK
jgi:phospholipid/cholesterol/gamma-HCH transport system ATP-binding protein